jgi:hypothetical protein
MYKLLSHLYNDSQYNLKQNTKCTYYLHKKANIVNNEQREKYSFNMGL